MIKALYQEIFEAEAALSAVHAFGTSGLYESMEEYRNEASRAASRLRDLQETKRYVWEG